MYEEKVILVDKIITLFTNLGYVNHIERYTVLVNDNSKDTNDVYTYLHDELVTCLYNIGVSISNDSSVVVCYTIANAIYNTSNDNELTMEIIDMIVDDLTDEDRLFKLITTSADMELSVETYHEAVVNVDGRVFIFIADLGTPDVEPEYLASIKELAVTKRTTLPAGTGIVYEIIMNLENVIVGELPFTPASFESLQLDKKHDNDIVLYLSMVFSLDIVDTRKQLGLAHG